MDRVFSVDDISGSFWSPAPPSQSMSEELKLNRNSSEWAFQRFLEEASASLSSASTPASASASAPSVTPPSVAPSSVPRQCDGGVDEVVEIKETHPPMDLVAPNASVDSDEYQAFLKQRLSLACAAVALTRTSSTRAQDSAPLGNSGSQASNSSQLGPQFCGKGSGSGFSTEQDKVLSGTLPVIQNNVHVRPTSSGSSREQSDDDELEGETETTENTDPTDVKRVRRMLSNRESARRSRRRKQAHLNELETQVSQLRVENSSLLKRLTDASQKYNEAAVDNRVLKADVETLRAKVKMAEETVKRVTGLHPLFQPMPEISTMGMPFAGNSPDISADATVPMQNEPKHHFYQPVPNTTTTPNGQGVNNGLPNIPPVLPPESIENSADVNKMGRSASMQRVASLEHLQKRICGETSHCDPIN